MQTSLTRRRSRLARPLSWLVVAGLASAALIGPAAGGVSADSTEPGSPDFVPNSGHTSSSGLTLAMGTATIDCDGDSVNSFDGSFTFSGADPGDHVVVYLAANNGSDASPAGNVQDNELTIDLDGKTSPVSFSIPITSAFTATKGGILIVFASSVEGQQTYSSKSNSLNCSDSTTTTTSTQTSTSTSTGTETSTSTETSTETSTGTETSTSTGTETSTSTSTETSTSTGTETSTSTGTETSTSTGTETSTETSTGTETSTSTATETSTGTESETTSTNTTNTTSSSSGGELGATGTPGATPPATDTVAASTPGSPDSGLRIVLLGLAMILAVILLLQPKDAINRR